MRNGARASGPLEPDVPGVRSGRIERRTWASAALQGCSSGRACFWIASDQLASMDGSRVGADRMQLSFWVFVYIAAAVQAGLLGVALWRRLVNRGANRILAVWVLLVGFDLLVKAVYWHTQSAGWVRVYHLVALFPFMYGSLFYVYVCALTQERGFRWRDTLHLLGFGVMLVLNLHAWTMDQAELQMSPVLWIAGERSWNPWFDVLLLAYSLSYVGAALLCVRRYRRALQASRSDADRHSLHWIDSMAWCQVAIWLFAAAVSLQHWFGEMPFNGYALLFGLVAVWVCVMGWLSLNQPPMVAEREPPSAVPAEASEAAPDDPRFDAVEARLAVLMEGPSALFLEPALTIGQVAKRSGYPEYLVSAVINRRLGGSFWDYVNRLRVEAARACLADTNDTRTILDIAYACGFTAKSTFNTAFKRQLGQTPSAFRQTVAISAERVDPQPEPSAGNGPP